MYYKLIYIIIIIVIIIIILIIIYYCGFILEHGNDINLDYNNLYYNNNVLTIDKIKDYLNFKEDLEPYLRNSSKKEIVFINNNIKTFKVLYVIHGFNADKNECKNIALDISKQYKYNVFLTRLPDHGIYNKEVSNNTFYTYLRTIHDDLLICSLLGDEIIIIGTSTGCTYGIIASVYFSNKFNIKDNIMFSPNIEPLWYVSYLTKFLASGYGSFIIGLTENKICLDNKKVSSNIFKPLIGSLMTLRSIKNKFTNNCIIFSSEKDSIVSVNATKNFFNNIKTNKKYLYIFKDLDIHPVSNYNIYVLMNKISDYFTNKDKIVNEYL